MQLRDLLASETAPEPSLTADAAHYATEHLGPAIAARITWEDRDGDVRGVLRADGPDELTLLFEVGEPDALAVQVPCWYGTCPGPAWAQVHEPRDLMDALNGQAEERHCEQPHLA